MTNKQKPDGWCAVHPVEGISLVTASRSKQYCEDRLLERFFGFKSSSDVFAKADIYYMARDIELTRAANENWRIRPIKLVFLDEGGEDDKAD